MKGRFAKGALAAVLACSLAPVPALADEPATGADGGAALAFEWEPGTYVEHEAIAYVVDGGVQPFSFGGDLIGGAETLMDVDAPAAAQALGEDSAAEADAASNGAAVRSRAQAADADEQSGRLVLVRDEAKTTEQLIAELSDDPRVVFAEPNAVVEESADEAEQQATAEATAARVEQLAETLAAEGDAATADAANAAGAADEFAAPDALEPADDADAADKPAAGDGDAAEGGASYLGTPPDLNHFVWGQSNDGRMGGISADEAVDVDYGAWETQTPDASADPVVVAVVDTGVDASNPDLAPVMWDEGQQHGLDAVEGADTYGFSAVAADGKPSYAGITNSHGTHVAGTIGAAWNGVGMSGVASNVELMAVRHNDRLATLLSCYDYLCKAIDAGVDVQVANNSWGLGLGQWRSIDLAVTQAGQRGLTSVFASGNHCYDNDAALSTAGTLADNPYVVTVNAIDPTGEVSAFTQYGETTTDVMAPGTGILSAYPVEDSQFIAEADPDAALYQSFDDANSTEETGTSVAGDALSFNVGAVMDAGKRFDGESALVLPYAPSKDNPLSYADSAEIDLSGLAEKPKYLSLRYTIDGTGVGKMPVVFAYVKQDDGEWSPALTSMKGAFGLGGDSWSGFFVELPSNTDWEHFHVQLAYAISGFSMVGGAQQMSGYVAGNVIVDSIGLGSTLVPYAYSQGTSMASPAVAGVAAVLAGQGTAEVAGNPAKSAEKLAALVKAAAVPDGRYAGLCSTGGYATVAGAQDPGPAIAEVVDDGDTVKVRGYFMNEDTAVTLDASAAPVQGCTDLGDGKVELTVKKPADFYGGQATVRAQANGKESRFGADLGQSTANTYYDEMNLPLPAEIDEWSNWQLVGFDGDVYCLPRTSILDETDHSFILRYNPDERAWSQVALPVEFAEKAGLTAIHDVTAATVDGKLLLLLSDTAKKYNGIFVTLSPDGTWADMGFSLGDGGVGAIAPTLASDGEDAYLFGGIQESNGVTVDGKGIFRVDFEKRAIEQAGELTTGRVVPQVTYRDGMFAVSGGWSYGTQESGITGIEMLRPLPEGTTDSKGEPLPAGWLSGLPVDMSPLVQEMGALGYAVAATADGFAFAGPESRSGNADTYTLATGAVTWDKASVPETYAKRASQQALWAPSALGYRGTLYVLAATENDPYQTFSATAVETAEQPGDAAIEPDPEPKPDPEPEPEPEPTPQPEDPGTQPGADDEGTGDPAGTTGTGAHGTATSNATANAKQLARTGDAAPLAAVVAAGAAAAAVAAGTTIARKRARK